MRHTTIRESDRVHSVRQLEWNIESDIRRIAHTDFNVLTYYFGFINSSIRQKSHLFRRETVQIGEFGDTSGTVAASFHLTAIGIEIAHAKVDVVSLFDEENTVSPNRHTALAEFFHKICIGTINDFRQIIDNDKVVACTAEFHKGYFIHSRSFTAEIWFGYMIILFGF